MSVSRLLNRLPQDLSIIIHSQDGSDAGEGPVSCMRLVEDGAQQEHVAVGSGGRSNKTRAWLCAAKERAIFAAVQFRK
jgi:hypothetical protein